MCTGLVSRASRRLLERNKKKQFDRSWCLMRYAICVSFAALELLDLRTRWIARTEGCPERIWIDIDRGVEQSGSSSGP